MALWSNKTVQVPGLTAVYASTGPITAQSRRHYILDTTSNTITVNLPSGVDGYSIRITDAKGTFLTNNVTVVPASGQKINNLATNESLILDANQMWIEFIWNSLSSSWIVNAPGILGLINNNTYTDYPYITSPSSPASSTLRLYAKSDGKLYTKNSSGTENKVGNGLDHPTINSTFESGSSNISMSGDFNTAIGVNSLPFLTTGFGNTGFGFNSGNSLTTGAHNTFIGVNSGLDIKEDANSNIAIGKDSLTQSTLANILNGNIAIGDESSIGYYNTNFTFNDNIGIGNFSLGSPISSSSITNNIGIGNYAASYLEQTCSNNLAIGTDATFQYAINSSNNIAIGNYALAEADNASHNIAIGDSTMSSSASGTNNIALGQGALQSFDSGSNNVAIGPQSGNLLLTGNHNTYINSQNSGVPINTSGAVTIGRDSSGGTAQATANNQFVFGTSNHLYQFPGTIQTPLVISANSTSAALRVTQTGTGNALVVEDETNPDSTPFVINNSGQLIRGGTQAVTVADEITGGQQSVGLENIGVANTYNGSAAFINYTNSTTNARPVTITLARSNGATFNSHTAVEDLDQLGSINFQGSDGTNFVRAASIRSEVNGTPGPGDMPGSLIFSTTADGSATPTERLRIDSLGAVGIGQNYGLTNSRIVVAGQSAGADGAYATGRGSIVLNEAGRASVNDTGGFEFKTSVFGSGYGAKIIALDNGSLMFGNRDNSATYTERMRVFSNGNVTIGTNVANNNRKFGVETSDSTGVGTIVAANQSAANSGVGGFTTSLGSGNGAQNNTNCWHFRGVTETVGIWYLYGNGTSSFTSDQRLKKNIEPARDGYIKDLCKLRVVKYNWISNDDSDAKELGLIAQEVEQVFPGLVQEADIEFEDGLKPKVIKSSVLPFILLKAIQEQQTIIDQLQNRISILENK